MGTGVVLGVLLAWGPGAFGVVASAYAQDAKQDSKKLPLEGPATPRAIPHHGPDSPIDPNQLGVPNPNLPPQLQRQYAHPDSYLPYGYRQTGPEFSHTGLSGSHHNFGHDIGHDLGHDVGHFGGHYSPYSYDYGFGSYYRYGGPYDYYDAEEAYRYGVTAGRRFAQYEFEADLGLHSYLDAMARGQEAFTKGDYAQAVRGFVLAVRLNQGDPASRVSAANALIALGRYHEAVALLRRAFELQPRLAYLPIDLRSDYGNKDDFYKHVAAVQQAAEKTGNDADAWFALGYCYYFSGHIDKAASALRQAVKLRPHDPLFQSLNDLARISTPADLHE